MSVGEVYIQASGHMAALNELGLEQYAPGVGTIATDIIDVANELTKTVEGIPAEHIANEVRFAATGLTKSLEGGNTVSQDALAFVWAADSAASTLPARRREVLNAIEELQLAIMGLADVLAATDENVSGCTMLLEQYLGGMIVQDDFELPS
ncbi:MAG TPA: hypothetical protein VLH86_01065 [Patescibacteria group bacterium]|nr:hypothetical protein [Patescibacteria group bacterium]